MSDETDPPPAEPIIKLVPPPPDPMKERGARLPDPPKPNRNSSMANDPESGELAAIVARVITVRGERKENLVPHWIAAGAMRCIDPHRMAPPLARMAASITLRDLAREEMRAFRPRPEALKWIAEAEEVDVRRKAAEEADAHHFRRAPAACALCGKPPGEGYGDDSSIHAADTRLRDVSRHDGRQ